ncbi:hypothetical protein PN497_25190 [Sphaerospermopsis kisseleviana CS-549]|uniref:Transposase n=1 Tax=Sphaerospermopsis kisseleviana CS-549 TaxID=3021783 RepID=A0ABT4ZYV6_9CYAN|nr:hypothetical protein [Sphaerospermopsis kisseleviana CS-549]
MVKNEAICILMMYSRWEMFDLLKLTDFQGVGVRVFGKISLTLLGFCGYN